MTKRAIHIFPDLPGMGDIEAVRASFDPLAGKVAPHVTLVFPFDSALDAGELATHVRSAVESIEPFAMSVGQAKSNEHGYVWLPVVKGRTQVLCIHDRLYTGVLGGLRSAAHTYEPHVTVAHVPESKVVAALHEALSLHSDGEAWVDRVVVERILQDDRSEIENTIMLRTGNQTLGGTAHGRPGGFGPETMKIVKFICDKATFVATDCAAVRWLDWDADFEMAQRYWSRIPCPLERKDWEEARDAGYRYCAVVEGKQIVALAAEYRFSDGAWMLAAVSTAQPYRRRGLGRQVSAFVTEHILKSGRLATCETREDNAAMIRTAESIGFRKSEPSGGTLRR